MQTINRLAKMETQDTNAKITPNRNWKTKVDHPHRQPRNMQKKKERWIEWLLQLATSIMQNLFPDPKGFCYYAYLL